MLSNLAELDLDNRHVLRVLGYRLMQAKQWALATQVFLQFLDKAEEEPQSGRDLGLAMAASGQRQRAIEQLYDVALGDWDSRFSGIPAIALNEMNAIIATSPKPLNTGFIDRRLVAEHAAGPSRCVVMGQRQQRHGPVGHRSERREVLLEQQAHLSGRLDLE